MASETTRVRWKTQCSCPLFRVPDGGVLLHTRIGAGYIVASKPGVQLLNVTAMSGLQ